MKPFKAMICAYVHHKGWCTKFHRTQRMSESWRSDCPFKDAAMIALFPPIIIGKLNSMMIDENVRDALNTPGAVIQGD